MFPFLCSKSRGFPPLLATFVAGLILLGSAAVSNGAAPPNDHFADAISLGAGVSGAGTGSNLEATREAGEQYEGTVWWTWTPSITGTAWADTAGSSFDTRVAVFTGDTIGTLNKVAENDLFYDSVTFLEQGRAEWLAVAGTMYRIAVIEGAGERGAIRLVTGVSPRPLNDTAEGATLLPGTATVHAKGSSEGAFLVSNSVETPSYAVWWNWTAPAEGVVEVDVSNSAIQAQVKVHLVSVPGRPVPDPAVPAGEITGFAQTVHRFHAKAGATYAIAVGFGSENASSKKGLRGELDLRLRQPAPGQQPPANDSLANASEIQALAELYSGDNTRASSEVLPFPGRGSLNHDVWFKWVAPSTGTFGVMLRKPALRPYCMLEIYRSSPVSGFERLAEAVAQSSFLGSMPIVAQADGIYYFRVGAYRQVECGPFTIEVRRAPVNDGFSTAMDLGSDVSENIDGSCIGASRESSENMFVDLRSVWYHWRAPANGLVTVLLTSREADRLNPALVVVSKSATLNLFRSGQVTPSRPASATSFQAVSGQLYKIVVLNGFGGLKKAQLGNGDFTLRLSMGNLGSPYQLWLLSYPELQGEAAGKKADSDGDGWTNLEELAFEGNPLARDDTNLRISLSDTSSMTVFWTSSLFTVGSGYGLPITITPEVSTDGILWKVPTAPEYEVTQQFVQVPFSIGSRTIVRLKVEDSNDP